MARLIDAEALKESVRKKFKALPDRCEINILVNAAPTIDAIPVEWIMKWSNKRYRETQRDVSIVDVLEAWQKEQEAQDG